MSIGATHNDRWALDDILRARQHIRLCNRSVFEDREYFPAYEKSIPHATICFQWRESMIDAMLNVAVFAALVLCIVGFGAWAHKRVP
jgi:hypothetical protein